MFLKNQGELTMRHIVFLLLLPLFLFARENPFFPVSDTPDIPLTTNRLDSESPLERVSIKLPSTARTIESVTIEYKNLDGSLSSKKVSLHNSIDWHLPIFISQNYESSPEKTLTKKHKQSKKSFIVYKKIASFRFISFYESGKRFKIVTKDKLLRSFLLVKPHRIVCDFKRDTNFGSFIKKIPKPSIFRKIRLGTHNGYYRVVIELDGYYRYKLKKYPYGYLYTLL